MRTRIGSVVSFVLLILVGCAYPESNVGDTGAQNKYNKLVENTYGHLQGTYEGTLTIPPGGRSRGNAPYAVAEVIPVEMVIYFSSESMTNPDGTPGNRKVPLAYLSIMGNWMERYTLRLEGYASERGTFAAQNTQTASIDSVKSAQLTLGGGEITGPLLSPTGTIGTLSVALKNRETSVPQESERERYDRLIENTYASLVGTYTGELSVPANSASVAQKVPAQMVIYFTNESATNPDGTPGFRRAVKAFVRISGTWLQAYTFNIEGYAKEGGAFSLQGSTTAANEIKSMILRTDGMHVNGDVQSIAGFMGTISFEMKSKETVVPRDIIRELEEQKRSLYQTFIGTYVGVIKSVEGNKPISIELTMHEVAGTVTLRGFYKRLDIPDGTIDLLLDVNVYRLESPIRFTMNGKGSLNYMISVETRLTSPGKMNGVLTTIKGPHGEVELSRK